MNKTKLELNLFDGEGTPTDSAPMADAQPQNDPNVQHVQANTDKGAEFEKLIKGEYKEQFEQRIKDNINRRFKESSELKAKASQSDGILDMLRQRYGLDGGNIDEIYNAVKNDENYITAQNEGEPDMMQRLQALEAENESIRARIEEGYQQRKMHSTINSWINDAKKLSDDYPDFDLSKEVENPLFQKMLKGGIDLKSAYYAIHHEDIVNSMVEKASRDATIKVTDSIKARGARPVENGISNKSTAILKTDVSKLTAKERADIAKRVMSGEEISF